LWEERRLSERKLFIQDPFRVQARTSPEELALVAKVVAGKLNRARGPVKFLIPHKGWSSLSVEGGPLYDPEADRAFVEEFKRLADKVDVKEVDLALNTPDFAQVTIKAFEEIMN